MKRSRGWNTFGADFLFSSETGQIESDTVPYLTSWNMVEAFNLNSPASSQHESTGSEIGSEVQRPARLLIFEEKFQFPILFH